MNGETERERERERGWETERESKESVLFACLDDDDDDEEEEEWVSYAKKTLEAKDLLKGR